MTVKVEKTDRCPGCGRPFATEITTGGCTTVLCQAGHSWAVERTEQRPGRRLYEINVEEKTT